MSQYGFTLDGLMRMLKEHEPAAPLPGWELIATAPKGKDIHVRLRGGKEYPAAHWAQNLSGEEQPVFSGWFVWIGENKRDGFYSEIETPTHWKEIAK